MSDAKADGCRRQRAKKLNDDDEMLVKVRKAFFNAQNIALPEILEEC